MKKLLQLLLSFLIQLIWTNCTISEKTSDQTASEESCAERYGKIADRCEKEGNFSPGAAEEKFLASSKDAFEPASMIQQADLNQLDLTIGMDDYEAMKEFLDSMDSWFGKVVRIDGYYTHLTGPYPCIMEKDDESCISIGVEIRVPEFGCIKEYGGWDGTPLSVTGLVCGYKTEYGVNYHVLVVPESCYLLK